MMGKFQKGCSEQLIGFGGLFMVLVRTSEAVKHAYQEACVGSDGICVYDRSSLVVESFKGVCLHWEGIGLSPVLKMAPTPAVGRLAV